MIRHIEVKHVEHPHIFHDHAKAHELLVGQGLELGAAAHNPFHLPGSRNVAPFSDDPQHPDYADFMLYRDAQVAMCGSYAAIDIVADAVNIPVEDASQDYVISSHVIEHIADPIAVFKEADRILKPGGVFFMIFPKRGAHPPDAKRPFSSLAHLIAIYEGREQPDAAQGHRGHYHVYSLDTMLELIAFLDSYVGINWEVIFTEQTDAKVGNGHTIVARKAGE